MKREQGYYWVKLDDAWMIAIWRGDLWNVRNIAITSDDRFDEIDENRISHKYYSGLLNETKKITEEIWGLFADIKKTSQDYKDRIKENEWANKIQQENHDNNRSANME